MNRILEVLFGVRMGHLHCIHQTLAAWDIAKPSTKLVIQMSTTLVLTFATSEQKETFMRHFLYFKCLEILTFAILLCLALAPSPGLASPGDVTGDGVANIVDLQCTIVSSLNVLAGIGAAPDCVFGEDYMADHDCSGTVDVSDVLISIQVGLGAPLSKELDADSDGCPDACSGKPQCIGLPKTEFFQLSCLKNNRPGDRRCFNDGSGGSIMVCADSCDAATGTCNNDYITGCSAA